MLSALPQLLSRPGHGQYIHIWYMSYGRDSVCRKGAMLKRKDRVITAWKVNTAPGKVGFLRGEGGPSEEVIYFSSADGNWRMLGRVPVVSLTRDGAPGATVLLLFLPPLLSHSLSISYLSDLFQSAAMVSLGEGREEEEERSCSFSMPSSPASQSDSIHPTLLWSAELCSALLSCSCIKRSWAVELTGLLPDLSACMWEVWRLIPALLINGIPITLQSH